MIDPKDLEDRLERLERRIIGFRQESPEALSKDTLIDKIALIQSQWAQISQGQIGSKHVSQLLRRIRRIKRRKDIVFDKIVESIDPVSGDFTLVLDREDESDGKPARESSSLSDNQALVQLQLLTSSYSKDTSDPWISMEDNIREISRVLGEIRSLSHLTDPASDHSQGQLGHSIQKNPKLLQDILLCIEKEKKLVERSEILKNRVNRLVDKYLNWVVLVNQTFMAISREIS